MMHTYSWLVVICYISYYRIGEQLSCFMFLLMLVAPPWEGEIRECPRLTMSIFIFNYAFKEIFSFINI
jgi:hypothetical protein